MLVIALYVSESRFLLSVNHQSDWVRARLALHDLILNNDIDNDLIGNWDHVLMVRISASELGSTKFPPTEGKQSLPGCHEAGRTSMRRDCEAASAQVRRKGRRWEAEAGWGEPRGHTKANADTPSPRGPT